MTGAVRVTRSMSPAARRIRRCPSLAKAWWSAVVLAHMAADESCGRLWSCQCGACRTARREGALGGDEPNKNE